MMRKVFEQKFIFILLAVSLLTALFAVGHWFVENNILYYWDSYLPFDVKNSFEQLFYTWQDSLFPGFSTAGWSWLLYYLLFFSTYPFLHSLSISQFVTYIFLITISVINFYLLSEYVLKNIFEKKISFILIRGSALVTALLYTFNTFTFFNFYFMFNPGTFILAFLPLNILALIHIYPLDGVVKSRNYWFIIYFISLFFMTPGFGVYVLFLQYLIWIAIYLLFFWIVGERRILVRKTFELAIFYILIIVANLWWFFPAFLEISGSYSGQSSFGTTYWFERGFEPSKLLNALRLLGSGLMINNKFSWNALYENSNLFTFPLLIFPFLFILSIVFLKNRINNFLKFLLSMTLVSLFIVKFSNPPFAMILGWAYHYVPFFGGFRDAFQKAGVYFIPGYFIIISIGFVFLVSYLLRKNRFLLFFFILIFIIGSLVLSGPFSLFFRDNIKAISFHFNDRKITIKAKTKIPDEYYSLKRFLEKSGCESETIAVIPRSGFVTDGIWGKYNTSYVGQDMLAGLINCNFISTAMFNEYAEYAIQAPYMLLQQGNYDAFKDYLDQAKIRYALIRHDYAPYGLISWVYVDPKQVEENLVKDEDFKKVYSDDFFSLYEKKNIEKQQFGFAITRDAIYLQSRMKSGVEYAAISEMIGSSSKEVLLTSPLDQLKYKKQIISRIISTDCLGCVKIELLESDIASGVVYNIKKYVKSIIRYDSKIPEDMNISLDIIKTNYSFSELVSSIQKNKYDKEIDNKISYYFQGWDQINTSIKKISDRFKKNNKYNEADVALSAQARSFYKFFSSDLLSGKKIYNEPENIKFASIMNFQKKLASDFSKNMVNTDSSRNIYRLRLDIPADGEYLCRVFPINSGIKINGISLENKILIEDEYQGLKKIKIKSGSYFVNIQYSGQQMIEKKTFLQASEGASEVNIGKLPVGTYKINFTLPSNLTGKLFFVITPGKFGKNLSEKMSFIENQTEDFILEDIIEKHRENAERYENTFLIKSQIAQDYYAYFFLLDPNNFKTEINDFSVTAHVRNDDIQFLCREDLRPKNLPLKISVFKENPTNYIVQIPLGFKGFLTFNETYHNDWIAYDEKEKRSFNHIRSGYSNSWYIDEAPSGKIIVEYKKQKISQIGSGISLLFFVLSLMVYAYIRRR